MFSFLKRRLQSELYIDLGTANTLVMDRDLGLIANEPSVIVFRSLANGKREIVAIGDDAKRKIGRTSGNLQTSHPLKNGVIAELDATEAMLRYFLHYSPQKFIKPRIVISLPYGVSDVERRAVIDCAIKAGAREAILIEEPMAAAIGAGLPVHQSCGSMVIDIGGGTTEAAVISLCGIVHCESVRVGGHGFDAAIVEHLRRRHNLIFGDQSAERVKIEIATAILTDNVKTREVRGIDFSTGLPRIVTVSSHDVFEAIDPLLSQIVMAGRRTLEQTPPELLADIIENGLLLIGGGSLIDGLDARISRDLGIRATRAADPLLAVARGGVNSLRDPDLLARISL